MHETVCNCVVSNVFAIFCMVPSCIDTVIVIRSDPCDIGVVQSENLKKLPALPAGSILAHYGVKSSCRGQQKHDRRRRREARLAGVTFSLPRRASLRWEGVQQLWAIARCWQQHCTILRDKHCYNCNILLLGVMYDSIIKVSPFHFLNIEWLDNRDEDYYHSTTRLGSKIFRVGYE